MDNRVLLGVSLNCIINLNILRDFKFTVIKIGHFLEVPTTF